MIELSHSQVQDVSGSISRNAFYVIANLFDITVAAVRSGNVDYSGLAETQGTYYNTVGA